MTDQIRVLLVDDEALIRSALEALLGRVPDIMVVGTAGNGHQGLSETVRARPDVVLMDMRMPGASGSETTARIRATASIAATKILILTTFDEPDTLRSCAAAGADGFIAKSATADALVAAIRAVCDGRRPVSSRLTYSSRRRALARSSMPAALDGLTPREREIVHLVATGRSNALIAERLSISPATVKTHVRNLMSKLDVHDRAQLIITLHRMGITG